MEQIGGGRVSGSSLYVNISGENYQTKNTSNNGAIGENGTNRRTGGGGSGSASCSGATTKAMNTHVYRRNRRERNFLFRWKLWSKYK
ncbi:MAG: hypothetical protein HFJ34_03890 [Clostridia bacterium]|nr:hypothetical protein [Clostridia bacterium]